MPGRAYRWRATAVGVPRGESPVKKIEAFIRHEAFEPIRSELLDKGFPSLSISEVKGSGRQKGMVEAYRGSSPDRLRAAEAEARGGRRRWRHRHGGRDHDQARAAPGEIGDGKIFVLPVEEAIRIRTGEEGEVVLQAHTEEEIAAGAAQDE